MFPTGEILEHRRIAFASYPQEWPAVLLHEAATLTLDFCEELLPEGLGLKDATPYNILFENSRPILVDCLSIEKRAPGDPIWLALGQFMRTFLNPLIAHHYYGLPPSGLFLRRREGLSASELFAMAGPFRRLTPFFF